MTADRWPDEIMPYEDERHEWLKVHGMGHPLWDIVTSFPHHLPKRPMSDIAALEAAVIQAADAYRVCTDPDKWVGFRDAVDALRAAKTPPPPPRTEWRVTTERRAAKAGEWYRHNDGALRAQGMGGVADVIVSWLPLDGGTQP